MVWKVMYKWVFLICVDQEFGNYKPTNIFSIFENNEKNVEKNLWEKGMKL